MSQPPQPGGEKGFRTKLPRRAAPEITGLGDVVKRVTSSVGIRPCSGCEERAVALNRRFPTRKREGR